MKDPAQVLSVTDLLENQDFRRWIFERDPEDKRYWEQWLVSNPAKRELYEQAAFVLIALERPASPLRDDQVEQYTEAILEKLHAGQRVTQPIWSVLLRWVAAATVILGIVWWQLARQPDDRPVRLVEKAGEVNREGWTEVMNHQQHPQLILLPDNSSVLLAMGSSLRYKITERRRDVNLEGEAFFEVAKHAGKPFFVHTAKLTTKVLGTTFQVRCFSNEAIASVKVKTGKVIVDFGSFAHKTVTLSGEHQLEVDLNAESVKTSTIQAGNQQKVLGHQFQFENEPVENLFDLLDTTYRIEIAYDKQAFRNCTFSGELDDMPFLEKLRLICLATGSSYALTDQMVTIQGKGCE